MSARTGTDVTAGITISLDGYVVGPNDGPGKGLGEGGERLHYWVFGGPWSYADEPTSEATGVDKQYLDEAAAHLGAVVAGRNMYEAAEAWGGSNPWDVPMFVVTHRTEDAPPADTGFTFVNGFDEAIAQAVDVAGDREVSVVGGADMVRQALAGGYVRELTITIAPVIMGDGKRLFEGFDRSIDLEQTRVLHSPLATHITYRVLH
jgi:dihydrofolate reductase